MRLIFKERWMFRGGRVMNRTGPSLIRVKTRIGTATQLSYAILYYRHRSRPPPTPTTSTSVPYVSLCSYKKCLCGHPSFYITVLTTNSSQDRLNWPLRPTNLYASSVHVSLILLLEYKFNLNWIWESTLFFIPIKSTSLIILFILLFFSWLSFLN